MKNKKQFFGVLISVLVSVFLVVFAVYAVSTIGEDITVGDDLTVTDHFAGVTASLSGNFNVAGKIISAGLWNSGMGAYEFVSFSNSDNVIVFPAGAMGWFDLNGALTQDVGFSLQADVGPNGGGSWAPDLILNTVYADSLTRIHSTVPLKLETSADSSDFILFQTTSNVPEIKTSGSADFKINAGGSNNLLLQHDGGYVGIGTINPTVEFAVSGAASVSGNFDMFGTFAANTAASHSFAGDLSIGDDLAVTGDLAITGKLTAIGNIDGASNASLILNDTLNQNVELFANVVGNPLFKIWGDYVDDSPVWASMGVDNEGYLTINAQRQIHFDQVVYFNSDTTQYEDVFITWAQAADKMVIAQTDTTGIAGTSLINIDDNRTGENANTTAESTIVLNAAGTYGLYLQTGQAYFADDVTMIEDVNITWGEPADHALIYQGAESGIEDQPLIKISDNRNAGPTVDEKGEATLHIDNEAASAWALLVTTGIAQFEGVVNMIANVDLGDSVANDIVTMDAVLRVGTVASTSAPSCAAGLESGLIIMSDSNNCTGAGAGGDGVLCICKSNTWTVIQDY